MYVVFGYSGSISLSARSWSFVARDEEVAIRRSPPDEPPVGVVD
jgi:hypothetical protein